MTSARSTAALRVVFGAGYTGARVAELAARRGERVVATVRSEARAAALEGRGFLVTRAPVLEVAERHVTEETHAIVCFPRDRRPARAAARTRARRRVRLDHRRLGLV